MKLPEPPPLPDFLRNLCAEGEMDAHAEEVRAYALSYGAAVREECAKVCDLLAHEDTTCQGDMADLYKFGEAIREEGE